MNSAHRVDKHKQFISANWSRIGSFAYGEFLAKGRGIVAVPEADFIDAQSPAYAAIRFCYFPDSEALSLMSDYEGSKEQGWVESYDPEAKVIVTIIRFDSGVSSYLIGTTPSPRESHLAEKAKGN